MSRDSRMDKSKAGGTVLIMAGGTGGHIFPALSIARSLQNRGYRTEWLGTPRGLEVEVLKDTDIPLHFIDARGLRGKGVVSLLLAPFMIVAALFQALRVLRTVAPCCVLGMGGYVTGPGGVAAKLSGYKLLIHEQNAIAGFSNRLLSRIADRVLEAFPGTFGSRTGAICTGNPVRAEIIAVGGSQWSSDIGSPLKVLVLGGSLGAVAINKVLPVAIQSIASDLRPQVWHQSGRNNLEATRDAYSSAGLPLNDDCRVVPFISDMAAAYAWADVVVCRAGAATVSEIAAAGVPSLLIPYPHAVDDHQTLNAHWLSDAGAAELIPQQELSSADVALRLVELAKDRGKLHAMSVAARGLARPAATEMVVQQCMEACTGK